MPQAASSASLSSTAQPTSSTSQVQAASIRSEGTSLSDPPLAQSKAQASHLPSTARPTVVPQEAVMASLHHIKWEVPDSSPQPSRDKCFLCERDLSYAAEGPYVQPNQPVVVAVLPCGHCFHAFCLDHVTPQDLAKDPPCIACAFGEK